MSTKPTAVPASLISHSGLRGHSELVEVRTLDSVLLEYFTGSTISLLKIDTEGFESHVIRGALATLRSGQVELIIMEVSPNFGEVSYLRSLNNLLGVEYKWFVLEERGKVRRMTKLRPISLQASLRLCEQWNLVLVRNDIYSAYCENGNSIFENAGK